VRIGTLLIAAVSAAIAIVAGLSFASWQMTQRMAALSAAQAQAQAVARDVSALVVLTHEYALHGEARAAQQWRSHYAAIEAALGAAADAGEPLPAEAIARAGMLPEIFAHFAATRQAPESALATRQTQVLLDQSLANIQILADLVHRWGSATAASRQESEARFRSLALATPLALLLILMLLAVLLTRRVLVPLSRLHKAVVAVGHGDLTVRSATAARDEFGDLARTFDAMAVDLVTELRNEIEGHRRTEAELDRHRRNLEQLVAERTRELATALDAAQAAGRAKSIFLANMSHELRTPLNGILGMTALALRRAGDPKQIEQLATVKRSAEGLLAMINDILDITKIEADRLVLEARDFTLAEVMAELARGAGPAAREKGLPLTIDVAADLADLHLRGDAGRLSQILGNLTDNAIKFAGGGSVTVRARIAEQSAGDLLARFEVCDKGVGIAEADLARLFTTFEQVDGSPTRRHGGAGLGLALCKRLSQAMGGDIGVDSQVGVGSTFWFTVRLTKRAGLAPTAEQLIRTRHPGARVLLAESEPINREIAHGLLEDAGLRVDVVSDGRDVPALARQTDYALILLDLHMPGLSGLAAIQAIRAMPERAATPILGLVSDVGDDNCPACLAAGMNDRIATPADPESLFPTLLHWLAQSRPASRQDKR
jgi:signal transduction histidine kinase/CheY-like chemotaxis protein